MKKYIKKLVLIVAFVYNFAYIFHVLWFAGMLYDISEKNIVYENFELFYIIALINAVILFIFMLRKNK